MTAPRSDSQRRRVVAGLTAALAAAACLLVASPAFADDREIKFTPQSTTVEYGSPWSTSAATAFQRCDQYVCGSRVVVDYTGPLSGELKKRLLSSIYLSSSDFPETLPVGSYSFSAAYRRDGAHGVTLTPFALTVAPAKLAVDLRVDADPSTASGAIVSAELTGDFVPQYSNCDECYPAQDVPAGTWQITVENSKGDSAFSQMVEKPQGESRTVSFYWPSVTPTTDFVAQATFTPDAAVAKNFAVTNDSAVTFTSAAQPARTDVPVAEEEEALAPTPSPAGVPLWVVGAIGIGCVILVVTAAFLALSVARLKRKAAATIAAPIVSTEVTA